jgi:hypothetical protein
MVAAEMPPAKKYKSQRTFNARASPVLRQLAGSRPSAAFSATAGTAAPAPAAAPTTQSGGCAARKSVESARMITRPGTMKQMPPITAPTRPRSRQAQKIASCVEAGPGRRFVAEMPSSNSCALSQ